MEKKKNLDTRFIQLREEFHHLQTAVRFSTSNRPGDIFTYHLKCYQIIGQLEQFFNHQKVSHLFEFIQSIFSLMFSMLRQLRPKQQKLKVQKQKADFGLQVDLLVCNKSQQGFIQQQPKKYLKKKRNCLQINLQDKQISEINFRERRRRLLKAMRDSIQEQHKYGEGYSLSFFKPETNKYNFSGVDETIKTAIDKFKQSDISTHIFLKHYTQQLSDADLNDIKQYSQIFDKQNIQKMVKFTSYYKQKRQNVKNKLKIKSQTCKQTVCPNQQLHKFRHSLSSLHSVSQVLQFPQKKKVHSSKKMRFPSVLSKLIEQQNHPSAHQQQNVQKQKSRSSQGFMKTKSSKSNSTKKLRKIISIQNQNFIGKPIQAQSKQNFLKPTSTASSSVELKNSILKKTTANKKDLNSRMQRFSRNSLYQ